MRNIWDFDDKDRTGFELFCIILGVILLLIGLFAFEAWVVMLLWNWLMPAIFSLSTIGFWQAMGISCLCHLLFSKTIKIEESK